MAYMKRSRSRGGEYRQVVESYREDGKVKQRVLVQLPPSSETPEHGLELVEAEAKRCREYAERAATDRRMLAHLTWRKATLRRAQEYTLKAQKLEAKARVIRSLIEAGKVKPDTPEVRQERERKRAEQERELAERWRIIREQ